MSFVYNLIAKVIAYPPIAKRIVRRAKRTPYSHITSSDGRDVYMERYWLFNRYDRGYKLLDGSWTDGPRWPRLPSIRLHVIRRPDSDRHLHDHPWNARTFVLRGWYAEQRLDDNLDLPHREMPRYYDMIMRDEGTTATLDYGEYHRITTVPKAGVYTLFVTFKYMGTWGFLVDGKKVPWREYLAEKQQPADVPYPVKIYAYGGITRFHDYEMSDGSIRTLKDDEAWAMGWGKRGLK